MADATGFKITIPREAFDDQQLDNLYNIVESWGTLIKKALRCDNTNIKVIGPDIVFEWFTFDCISITKEQFMAASVLIKRIIQFALKSKFIYKENTAISSEKRAFYTWMQRIGMKGKQYSDTRKFLLQNLDGSLRE